MIKVIGNKGAVDIPHFKQELKRLFENGKWNSCADCRKKLKDIAYGRNDI